MEDDLVEQFDRRAAETGHHGRAELRVSNRAADDLEPGLEHRGDEEPGVRAFARRTSGEERLRPLSDRGRSREVEEHVASLAAMDGAGGDELHGGAGPVVRGVRRLVRVRRHPPLRNLEARDLEQGSRLRFRQGSARSVGVEEARRVPVERRGGSGSGRVAAGGGGLRAASRVPQPREHLHRVVGRADDRDARVAQDRVTRGRDVGVDGLEDDRLAVPGSDGGDRLGGRDLARREAGAPDPVVAAEMTRDHDRVGVGSGETDGQGLGEDGRVALDHPGEVERVRDRRPWREKSRERVTRRARERGQRESRKTETIGEDRRVAATVGDERHPVPRERRASAERLRDRPRLGDAVRAQDPGAAKRGGGDAVLAGEGAGMGQRGPASRLGPPRLEDHHRFPRGMAADRIHQGAPAPLTHSLEVREDDLRVGIVQAIGDEIDGIEVGRVADRCLPGESEPGRPGAKVEVEEEVPALGDEGDRPGRNLRAAKIDAGGS